MVGSQVPFACTCVNQTQFKLASTPYICRNSENANTIREHIIIGSSYSFNYKITKKEKKTHRAKIIIGENFDLAAFFFQWFYARYFVTCHCIQNGILCCKCLSFLCDRFYILIFTDSFLFGRFVVQFGVYFFLSLNFCFLFFSFLF